MSDHETNPIREAISDAIEQNEVILFMKGTPDAPACGFSMRTVAALQALDARFAAVDILPDPRIRQQLSALSQWPTIPQLFAHGELVGGCDIVTEMAESRELDMDSFADFYARLRTDPELPTTSQPSIGDFLEVWEPLLDQGKDIVSV